MSFESWNLQRYIMCQSTVSVQQLAVHAVITAQTCWWRRDAPGSSSRDHSACRCQDAAPADEFQPRSLHSRLPLHTTSTYSPCDTCRVSGQAGSSKKTTGDNWRRFAKPYAQLTMSTRCYWQLKTKRSRKSTQNRNLITNKKLGYGRGTTRCIMPVEILPIARQVQNKSKLWSWRITVGRCVINMCTQPWRDRVASIVL